MELEQKHIDNIARWFQLRRVLWQRASKILNMDAQIKSLSWISERFPIKKRTEILYWLAGKIKKSPLQTHRLITKHKIKDQALGLGVAVLVPLILGGLAIVVAAWRAPAVLASVFNYNTKRAADEISAWNKAQKKLFEAGKLTQAEYLRNVKVPKPTTWIDKIITFGGLGILAYISLRATGVLKKRSRLAQGKT